jgi:hypothetical protein
MAYADMQVKYEAWISLWHILDTRKVGNVGNSDLNTQSVLELKSGGGGIRRDCVL